MPAPHTATPQHITRRSDGVFTNNSTFTDRIDSQNITVNDNGTVTVTFSVIMGDLVTLASYHKIGPRWSPKTEAKQQFVDNDTVTVGSGTPTLTNRGDQ